MVAKFRSENDHPFKEVADTAHRKILDGWTIFQKFTCQGCGARITIDIPNSFFAIGHCQECGHFSDLLIHGCNYLAVRGVGQVNITGGDDDTTRH